MADVLRDRDLTRKAIAEGFRWTMAEALPNEAKTSEEGLPDKLLMAMGGLYEVVYANLMRGEMPDVASCTLPSVLTFAQLNEIQMPSEGIEAHAITDEDLHPLANRAVQLIEWY